MRRIRFARRWRHGLRLGHRLGCRESGQGEVDGGLERNALRLPLLGRGGIRLRLGRRRTRVSVGRLRCGRVPNAVRIPRHLHKWGARHTQRRAQSLGHSKHRRQRTKICSAGGNLLGWSCGVFTWAAQGRRWDHVVAGAARCRTGLLSRASGSMYIPEPTSTLHGHATTGYNGTSRR